jgi:hypothetical protein
MVASNDESEDVEGYVSQKLYDLTYSSVERPTEDERT